MSRKTATTKKKDAEAEVEELLKSVEDDMLLNLSLNSHMSRVSPNYVDSDLDGRFRALKSPPSSSSSPNPPPPPPPPTTSAVDPPPRRSPPEHPADPELTAVLGDDLAARFAALKASLSSPQSVGAKASEGGDGHEEDEDEDDEVEKLIRWAKDAARLDPSPPSGDDDDDDDDDVNEDDDDDGDGDDRRQKKFVSSSELNANQEKRFRKSSCSTECRSDGLEGFEENCKCERTRKKKSLT